MSECEFCLPEGLCGLFEEKCKHKDEIGFCTAKPEDLIEICEDCDKPVDECDCGTNWILVHDTEGRVVPITPKVYGLLKKGENHAK